MYAIILEHTIICDSWDFNCFEIEVPCKVPLDRWPYSTGNVPISRTTSGAVPMLRVRRLARVVDNCESDR